MTKQPNTIPRFFIIALSFCMFTTGAVGLIAQYVLISVSSNILGNSREQVALVIGSMLLMMGVSGFVQKRMSDNNLIQKFISLEIAMAIFAGFAPIVVFYAFAYLEYNFLFVYYAFVLTIGFLIGFEIPLVMRIISKHNIDIKDNIDAVYTWDYAGAFIGSLVWVFFLLAKFPLTEISIMTAALNFAVAVFAILYFIKTKMITKPRNNLVALFMTFILLVVVYIYNTDISKFVGQKFYEEPVVYSKTTPYQHLVVTFTRLTGDTRLYINGNLQFSSLDEVRYHEALVTPLMEAVREKCGNVPASKKCNVLVLGGGDGLALRKLNEYENIEKVTLVDLDPEMIRIASSNKYLSKINNNAFKNARVITDKFSGSDSGEKVGVYLFEGSKFATESELVAEVDVFNVDADMFFRNKPETKWDAVIIDLPDPSSIEVSKLYSKKFYHTLKRYIKDDALISIQSTSPYHAKEAYLSIGATLRAVGFKTLPYRLNIPSFGDWGYYLAWKNEETPKELKNRLSNIVEFNVEQEFLTPDLLAATFAFGKGELELDDVCVNTIMEPCLLDRYVSHSWIVE
jgi:spermidine synthase